MAKKRKWRPGLPEGEAFAAVKSDIASRDGARNPAAVAAAAGRAALGQKEMTQRSVRGRKRAAAKRTRRRWVPPE